MPKETILVVEDDGILSLHLQDELSALGYSVVGPVATGEAAITAAAEHEPDLVLMDIKLAGEMNGISAAKEILESSNVPVIFLTSYSDCQLVEQAKNLAPYGYLIKPVSNRELATSIEMALARNKRDRKIVENEEQFRAIWEKSTEGMRLTDKNGTIVLVNDAFSSQVGKSRDELEGHPLDSVYDSSEGKTVLNTIVAEFSNKTVVHHREHQFTLWDGRKVWFDIYNTFIDLNRDRHFLLSVFRDTTSHRWAEEYNEAIQKQLRMLVNHLQVVRDEECKHLSREISDQLHQILIALKMDLSVSKSILANRSKELSRADMAADVDSMLAMIDEASGIIRVILSELWPETLDHLGISATLEWEVEGFRRQSGIPCTFTSTLDEIALHPSQSIALYRIFQEAILNVAQHSEATNVDVELRKEDDFFVLEIKDNGIGISTDAEAKVNCFGLLGIRERAILLGGSVEIHGVEGKGTTILARLPLEQTVAYRRTP